MRDGFTSQATIDRPTAEVWSFLTDWSNAGEWMNGVEDLSGPVEAGATLTFTWRRNRRTTDVVAVDPGRSITLRSRQSGATADYTYTLTPVGDATDARLDATCVLRGPIRLGGPVIRFMMKRTDGGQMPALKRAIESS